MQIPNVPNVLIAIENICKLQSHRCGGNSGYSKGI